MSSISYDGSPLITVSVLDTSISAETRHGGDEVHLLFGPVTMVLLAAQAVEAVAALRGVLE